LVALVAKLDRHCGFESRDRVGERTSTNSFGPCGFHRLFFILKRALGGSPASRPLLTVMAYSVAWDACRVFGGFLSPFLCVFFLFFVFLGGLTRSLWECSSESSWHVGWLAALVVMSFFIFFFAPAVVCCGQSLAWVGWAWSHMRRINFNLLAVV